MHAHTASVAVGACIIFAETFGFLIKWNDFIAYLCIHVYFSQISSIILHDCV